MSEYLFEDFKEPCQLLDRQSVTGPYGPQYTWTPGAEFSAALIKNETLAAKVAEKEGVTEVYNVYADVNVDLDFHDVFRRKSDGTTFRVTTNAADSKTPAVASFSFAKVTAERWDIPSA